MPVQLKLLLPGLLILACAAAVTLWPSGGAFGQAGWLLAGAVSLLAWQALLNERASLRAVRAALSGCSGPSLPAPPWRDVVARIESLLAASARDQSDLRRTLEHAKELETALQDSEQRYLLAVNGATDGLWEWDLASERVRLSPRCKHMLGLTEPDPWVPLQAWRARLHPQDRAEALDALQAHLRGRAERYEHAHRLLHADGQYRWVLSRATALRHASGRAYRVIGMDTDITRLKRVESLIEAIAEGTSGCAGEAFFRAMVRNFARAMHVDCAFITACEHDSPTRVRTLAFWRGDGFAESFEYELAGTPCERVLREGRIVFQDKDLGASYPAERHYESYLGLPIRGRDGRVIGHLAFLDRAPMAQEMLVEPVYRIFTARAAVEMELASALERLSELARASSQAGPSA